MARVRSWPEFYADAPTFSGAMRQVASHLPLIEELAPCGRVLEVGVGSGSLSSFLGNVTNVAVVDTDEHVLRTAARNPIHGGSGVGLVRADGMRIPFKDDSFDAVYSQGLWEHFDDSAVHAFTREGLRVAPAVFASIPTRWYPHIGRIWRPMLRGDERLLDRDRWLAILRDGGFRAEAAYYPDIKLLTVGGWTAPWPVHLLIKVTRSR
jgi:SAM-dependent methyltransferase